MLSITRWNLVEDWFFLGAAAVWVENVICDSLSLSQSTTTIARISLSLSTF